MLFQPPRTTASPLLKLSNILKFMGVINLQNFLYAHDNLKDNLPTALKGNMDFLHHNHETRLITGNAQLAKSRSKTVIYGSKSIKNRSIDVWNSINKSYERVKFLEKSRAVCKILIKKLLLSKY